MPSSVRGTGLGQGGGMNPASCFASGPAKPALHPSSTPHPRADKTWKHRGREAITWLCLHWEDGDTFTSFPISNAALVPSRS